MTAASILRRPQYALVLILALTTLAYWPGLTGGFAFDDYPNILLNPAITDSDLSVTGLANAAWSGVAGPLKRPIAMISFVLNYDTTGGSPLAFKLTNLGIHLLNGLLVFWFAILILRARAALRGAPLRVVAHALVGDARVGTPPPQRRGLETSAVLSQAERESE